MDGVGEWATTSAWMGEGASLTPLWEIPFPHSLGLLYSAFTYYTGFKVNSGEYKVMGLAPYGRPKYVQAIYDHLMDLKPDGTFRLNIDYFNYCTGLTMTNGKFDKLFDGPPRKPESPLTQREMDLARSVQEITEEVMLRLGADGPQETGAENLCLAGGVALNCVGNGRILREGPFKNIWIQPAAGDAGGAVGAAYAAWHQLGRQPRAGARRQGRDAGQLSGSGVSERRDRDGSSKTRGAPYERLDEATLLSPRGRRTGFRKGRRLVVRARWSSVRERSAGAAFSAIPRSPKMQSVMNLKIKYRESFRPFAPSVLRERVSDYFEMDVDSPYMLLVAPVAGQAGVGDELPSRKRSGESICSTFRVRTFRRSPTSITRRGFRRFTRTRIRAITDC